MVAFSEKATAIRPFTFLQINDSTSLETKRDGEQNPYVEYVVSENDNGEIKITVKCDETDITNKQLSLYYYPTVDVVKSTGETQHFDIKNNCYTIIGVLTYYVAEGIYSGHSDLTIELGCDALNIAYDSIELTNKNIGTLENIVKETVADGQMNISFRFVKEKAGEAVLYATGKYMEDGIRKVMITPIAIITLIKKTVVEG